MTDPFSMTASSFAVVNAADLVCKAIKEIYSFIMAMKSASQAIELLGEQLLVLEEIVAKVKDYWSKSEETSDQHDTLPAFLSSLTGFKRELEVLKDFFKPSSGADRSLGERLKWVMQESKVSQAMDRLEKHKTSLIATLTIVGRRYDIVLQQDIKSLRSQLNQLILTSSPPTRPEIVQMPLPPPNTYFTGREKEQEAIKQAFSTSLSPSARRVIIWGCGGSGKTQLALKFAHEYSKNCGPVFWVSASTKKTLRTGFAELCHYLGLPEGREPDLSNNTLLQQKAIASVLAWFARTKDVDWLLIIDNADEPKDIGINDFLPPTSHGNVIVTSRNRQAADGTRVELREMNAEDATRLLLTRSQIQSPTDAERAEAASLVKSLGYLALAVDHAGAYIDSIDGTKIEEYIELLETERLERMKDKPDVAFYEHSVFATFAMSFEKIRQRDELASGLLTILGFLDPEGLDESLFTIKIGDADIFMRHFAGNQARYRSALQLLTSFSLVRRRVMGPRRLLVLHPLIHSCCRDSLTPQSQRSWWTQVIDFLNLASTDPTKGSEVFRHLTYVIQLWKMSPLQVDEHDEVKTLCYVAATLVNKFITYWHYQGMMVGLYHICERLVPCLEATAEMHGVMVLATIVEIQSVTAAYLRKSGTEIRRNFFEKWCSKATLQALEIARNSNHSGAVSEPKCLSDVFKACPSTDKMISQAGACLANILSKAMRAAVKDKNWNEAMLLARLSELPYEVGGDSFLPDATAYVAWAQMAHSGDYQSLAIALRQRIQRCADSPVSQLLRVAMMDFATMALRVKQPQLVEEVLAPLLSNGTPQSAALGQFLTAYIWLRKALISAKVQQGKFDDAERLLLETCDAIQNSPNKGGLGTMHTSYLLMRFFERSETRSEEDMAKYQAKFLETFKSLYGLREQLLSCDGLNMSIILLEQGFLEEAEFFFGYSYALAKEILGEGHESTIKALKLQRQTQLELDSARGHEAAGLHTWEFGGQFFPRSIDI